MSNYNKGLAALLEKPTNRAAKKLTNLGITPNAPSLFAELDEIYDQVIKEQKEPVTPNLIKLFGEFVKKQDPSRTDGKPLNVAEVISFLSMYNGTKIKNLDKPKKEFALGIIDGQIASLIEEIDDIAKNSKEYFPDMPPIYQSWLDQVNTYVKGIKGLQDLLVLSFVVENNGSGYNKSRKNNAAGRRKTRKMHGGNGNGAGGTGAGAVVPARATADQLRQLVVAAHQAEAAGYVADNAAELQVQAARRRAAAAARSENLAHFRRIVQENLVALIIGLLVILFGIGGFLFSKEAVGATVYYGKAAVDLTQDIAVKVTPFEMGRQLFGGKPDSDGLFPEEVLPQLVEYKLLQDAKPRAKVGPLISEILPGPHWEVPGAASSFSGVLFNFSKNEVVTRLLDKIKEKHAGAKIALTVSQSARATCEGELPWYTKFSSYVVESCKTEKKAANTAKAAANNASANLALVTFGSQNWKPENSEIFSTMGHAIDLFADLTVGNDSSPVKQINEAFKGVLCTGLPSESVTSLSLARDGFSSMLERCDVAIDKAAGNATGIVPPIAELAKAGNRLKLAIEADAARKVEAAAEQGDEMLSILQARLDAGNEGSNILRGILEAKQVRAESESSDPNVLTKGDFGQMIQRIYIMQTRGIGIPNDKAVILEIAGHMIQQAAIFKRAGETAPLVTARQFDRAHKSEKYKRHPLVKLLGAVSGMGTALALGLLTRFVVLGSMSGVLALAAIGMRALNAFRRQENAAAALRVQQDLIQRLGDGVVDAADAVRIAAALRMVAGNNIAPDDFRAIQELAREPAAALEPPNPDDLARALPPGAARRALPPIPRANARPAAAPLALPPIPPAPEANAAARRNAGNGGLPAVMVPPPPPAVAGANGNARAGNGAAAGAAAAPHGGRRRRHRTRAIIRRRKHRRSTRRSNRH